MFDAPQPARRKARYDASKGRPSAASVDRGPDGHLLHANKNLACNHACYFQGRETWGAYFGTDGLIYASDFWLGFFIVQPPG